jgi:hypothetical protein
VAEGQLEEKQVKVEHYYNPRFEVFVRMPPYILDTDENVEVSVKALFTFEKMAYGNVHLRWYAKLSDGHTAFYNDTVLYRKEFKNMKCSGFCLSLVPKGLNPFTGGIYYDRYSIEKQLPQLS